MKSPFQAPSLCILIYAASQETNTGTFAGVILTFAPHRHNVLVISTCVTCDITSPSLLTCISSAIFWQDAFNTLPGLFLGSYFGFHTPKENVLHITGCFDILKGGGGGLFESTEVKKKRCLINVQFALNCCFAKKKKKDKGGEAQTPPVSTSVHTNSTTQHGIQPLVCKHSDYDFSKFIVSSRSQNFMATLLQQLIGFKV